MDASFYGVTLREALQYTVRASYSVVHAVCLYVPTREASTESATAASVSAATLSPSMLVLIHRQLICLGSLLERLTRLCHFRKGHVELRRAPILPLVGCRLPIQTSINRHITNARWDVVRLSRLGTQPARELRVVPRTR